jgi:hypothetical protein
MKNEERNVEIMTVSVKQDDGKFTMSECQSLPPPPNPKQSNKRIAVVVLTLLVAITLVFALIVVFPRATSTTSQQLTSFNWSGYCAVSDLVSPQPQVSSVSASWTVPAVDVSIGNSYSAAWIGVGGQYDETLIQVGTEQDSINGETAYSAWYELLPSYAVTIDTLDISPGDKVTTSISLSDRAANTWLIEINMLQMGNHSRKV